MVSLPFFITTPTPNGTKIETVWLDTKKLTVSTVTLQGLSLLSGWKLRPSRFLRSSRVPWSTRLHGPRINGVIVDGRRTRTDQGRDGRVCRGKKSLGRILRNYHCHSHWYCFDPLPNPRPTGPGPRPNDRTPEYRVVVRCTKSTGRRTALDLRLTRVHPLSSFIRFLRGRTGPGWVGLRPVSACTKF